MNSKLVYIVAGATLLLGSVGSIAIQAYAQNSSTATITNNGASAQLSNIKFGNKVFVEGAVTGTTVKATSISLSHPNFKGHEDSTNDGETNDDGGTSPSSSTSLN